jgi:hypothetical protein
MAIKLNNFENWRTDTEYEDNLIAKTFVFQFVNSYAALIYIAFIKVSFNQDSKEPAVVLRMTFLNYLTAKSGQGRQMSHIVL